MVMIAVHLALRFGLESSPRVYLLPLWWVLAFGGVPLVWGLLVKMVRREFGSDLLAGISIVVSALLGEYLAGSLVVLMLSGGEALEAYAVRSASSVLRAEQAHAVGRPSQSRRRGGGRGAGPGRDRRYAGRLSARDLSDRRHRRWRGTASWTNRT